MAGSAGNLVGILALAAFFFGIFGPVRTFMLVGLALFGVAVIAFFVEEFGSSR